MWSVPTGIMYCAGNNTCSHLVHRELSWSLITDEHMFKWTTLFVVFARYPSQVEKKTLCAMFAAPHQIILSDPKKKKKIGSFCSTKEKISIQAKDINKSLTLLLCPTWEWLVWQRHDSLISKNDCSRWNARAEPGTCLWGRGLYASSFSLHFSILLTPSFSALVAKLKTSTKHESCHYFFADSQDVPLNVN